MHSREPAIRHASLPNYSHGVAVRMIHAALFAVSILATCGLALALSPALFERDFLKTFVAALVIAKIAAFELFRLHRASWRWFDLPDIAVITIANTSGSVLAAVALGPRVASLDLAALVIIDWFVSQGFLLGSRLLFRMLQEKSARAAASQPRKRILIYGCGRRGMNLLRRIRDNPISRFEVAGFIDDDPASRHRLIQMTPVLGNGAELPRLARLHEVDEILVADAWLGASARARIRELAGFARLPCRFPSKGHAVRTRSL